MLVKDPGSDTQDGRQLFVLYVKKQHVAYEEARLNGALVSLAVVATWVWRLPHNHVEMAQHGGVVALTTYLFRGSLS